MDPPIVEFLKSVDSTQTVKVNQDLVLTPKVSGIQNSYSWIEDGKELAHSATYLFKRDKPGTYTLTFTSANEGGSSSISYKIKVLGKYGDGILLLNYTNAADKNAEISYLAPDGTLSKNVFVAENEASALSVSANSLYHYGTQYFITSATGPNYLTVVNDQTLKQEYTVTQSAISGITYFATTDGKTGYVNITNRRKPGLYPVDLAGRSISGTIVPGSDALTLLPFNMVNQKLLMPAGKQLIQLTDDKTVPVKICQDNVSGVATINGNIWVGVQSGANAAKFVRYDANLNALDSVSLGATFKLPANGILTFSGKDEFIYWQETSRGVTCRFNTLTKVAEEFVDHASAGISFATAWKVNPQTGELYIADSPGLFTGDNNNSDLYIFSKTGALKKQLKSVGYWVTDIVFP